MSPSASGPPRWAQWLSRAYSLPSTRKTAISRRPATTTRAPGSGKSWMLPALYSIMGGRIVTGVRPPSVDALARELADVGLPHPLLVDAAREAVAAGDPSSARARAESVAAALLRPVVNATGVLLHTNMGRAPLAHSQPAAYWNLELDL